MTRHKILDGMDQEGALRLSLSDSALHLHKKSENWIEETDNEIVKQGHQSTGKRVCRRTKNFRKRFSLINAAQHIRNFLAPDYFKRRDEFKRIFRFDSNERFIADYSSAYQREILAHGRMYISEHWLCFHANILSWETTIAINFKDITSIKKKKTVKFIPNAIQVCTSTGQKLFFTSFVARTKTFNVLSKVWKINLSDKEMDFDYIWHWVHDSRPKSVCSSKEAEEREKSMPSGFCRSRVFSEPPLDHAMNDIYEEEDEDNVDYQATNGLTQMTSEKKRHLSDKLDQNTESKLQFTLSSDSSTDRGLGSSSSSSSSNNGKSGERQDGSSSDSNYSDNVFETSCTCKSHFGVELLNLVLPVPMEKLYAMVFEKCDASDKFHKFQKCSSFVFTDWVKGPNENLQNRKITYTTQLNYSFGPKSCQVIESQEKKTLENQLTIVCECRNVGIPSGDIFDVGLTYCITRISGHTCRLRGFGGLIFRKNCWGFFKNLLEKTAFSAVEQHFTDLGNHLRNECSSLNRGKRTSIELFHSCTSLYDALSRSKKHLNRKPKQNGRRRDSRRHDRSKNSDFQYMFVFLTIILILLVCLNVLLYANLWLQYTDTGNLDGYSALRSLWVNPRQIDFKQKLLALVKQLNYAVSRVEGLLTELKTKMSR